MQTFLPYENFKKSADVLDKKRCWKQVGEAKQILSTLEKLAKGEKPGWGNHPAVQMWVGYEPALMHYFDHFLQICIYEHRINTKYTYLLHGVYTREDFDNIKYPWWLGNEDFHRAMRARLIAKDESFYLQKFPDDKGFNDGKYFWPVMDGSKKFKTI